MFASKSSLCGGPERKKAVKHITNNVYTFIFAIIFFFFFFLRFLLFFMFTYAEDLKKSSGSMKEWRFTRHN